MIAVSNTTPLRYLVAIEQERLFPGLFEKVFVPRAVHEELTNAGTPERIKRFVLSLPGWYEVREVRSAPTHALPVTLHRCEREAILLAEDLRPDFILIDDQAGRTVALKRNLPVLGTIGVLERADSLGILPDLRKILTMLKSSGFFVSSTLEFEVLLRHARRREVR